MVDVFLPRREYVVLYSHLRAECLFRGKIEHVVVPQMVRRSDYLESEKWVEGSEKSTCTSNCKRPNNPALQVFS